MRGGQALKREGAILFSSSSQRILHGRFVGKDALGGGRDRRVGGQYALGGARDRRVGGRDALGGARDRRVGGHETHVGARDRGWGIKTGTGLSRNLPP